MTEYILIVVPLQGDGGQDRADERPIIEYILGSTDDFETAPGRGLSDLSHDAGIAPHVSIMAAKVLSSASAHGAEPSAVPVAGMEDSDSTAAGGAPQVKIMALRVGTPESCDPSHSGSIEENIPLIRAVGSGYEDSLLIGKVLRNSSAQVTGRTDGQITVVERAIVEMVGLATVAPPTDDGEPQPDSESVDCVQSGKQQAPDGGLAQRTYFDHAPSGSGSGILFWAAMTDPE